MPHSPSPPFALAGALVIALGLSACEKPGPAEPDNQVNMVQPLKPDKEDEGTLAEALLDREQLLVTLLEAASAAVIGADDSKAQQALNGRRFEIRMRFGCPSGQPSADRSWSHNARSGSLKVTVKPDIDREVAGLAPGQPASGGPKARESGFSIPAPTVLANGCPTAEYAAAAGFTNLRFGLVQRTGSDVPRSRQLLDSYEIVKKIAPEEVPAEGLDLIVRGRLETGSDGRAIRCAPRGGTIECLASASIGLVTIEDPAKRRLIAEWGGT